jgi:hypothetical protein
MRRLLAVAVFLTCTSLASACINDRESNQSEKEFKSNYIDKPVQPASPAPTDNNNLLVIGGTTAGTSLLLGACAVGFFLTRRPNEQ